jgi:K+-sensing histidine kinase KdpD
MRGCRAAIACTSGIAPRVGKTYTALEELIRRKQRGTDAVIGFIETLGRPRTAELASPGITVISTVTIQHLESLADIVASITGVHVRERVPDRVIDDADEVGLIDMSPRAATAHGATSIRPSVPNARWTRSSAKGT